MVQIKTEKNDGLAGVKEESSIKSSGDNDNDQSAKKIDEICCSECNLFFEFRVDLVLHEFSHKNSNFQRASAAKKGKNFLKNKKKCVLCKANFKTSIELQQHLEQNHRRSTLNCRVEGCEYSCQSFADLRKHKKQHDSNKKRDKHQLKKFLCIICKKPFETKVQLLKHKTYELCQSTEKTKHYGTPVDDERHLINCGRCKKTFKTHYGLKNHFSKKHIPVICKICLKKFASIKGGMTHHRKFHCEDLIQQKPKNGTNKNLQCEKCTTLDEVIRWA